jgi:hypothetical protein
VTYRPGTLLVSARFVGRHVSVRAALMAHVVDDGHVKALIEAAAREPLHEVRLEHGAAQRDAAARSMAGATASGPAAVGLAGLALNFNPRGCPPGLERPANRRAG